MCVLHMFEGILVFQGQELLVGTAPAPVPISPRSLLPLVKNVMKNQVRTRPRAVVFLNVSETRILAVYKRDEDEDTSVGLIKASEISCCCEGSSSRRVLDETSFMSFKP